MNKIRLLYFIIFATAIVFTSCNSMLKATVCNYSPQYALHVDSVTVNDKKTPAISLHLSSNDGSIEFGDNDVKVIMKTADTIVASKGAPYSLCLTNLKGSLLSINHSEITGNGNFVFDNNSRSPYIPRMKTYCLDFKEKALDFKSNKFILRDKNEYAIGSDYNQAYKYFYQKIENIKLLKPKSFSSYITFLVHFYDGTVKYFTVYLTYEALKYDINVFKQEYQYGSSIY